jgi:hypothetical protein
MNLKNLAMGAAAAASVGVGSIATATPAEAGVLNFGDTVRVQNVGGGTGNPLVVNFASFANPSTGTATIGSPTDVFFGTTGSSITLKDLTLTNTGLNSWALAATVPSFITGLAGGVTFDLNRFELVRVNTGPLANRGFFADYSGIFSNFPDATGVGSFTTQLSAANRRGALFSSTVNVPTPALLPALLGMGAAALRKRKGEAAELEQETVKA